MTEAGKFEGGGSTKACRGGTCGVRKACAGPLQEGTPSQGLAGGGVSVRELACEMCY